METFEQYGIEIPYRRTKGNVKCVCPKCKAEGKRTHPNDRSLSVNIDEGVWHCHYCNWSGKLRDAKGVTYRAVKEYRRPEPRQSHEYSDKLVAWFNGRGISEWVLKKMRISEGLHYMPQYRHPINTVQFCYYLNGELVNVKYRTGDKRFCMESGAELVPYNIDAISETDTCIVTEGEMDALSFVECGYDNVVSVPNGANNNTSYLDDFIEGWFRDKTAIYIASDVDEKGIQLREELIRRFGAERCRIVEYGEGCKDANDHLQRYGKESLKKCLENAREVPIEGIYSLPDYENELDHIYKKGLARGYTVGHNDFDDLISFETKRLAVVTGVPSSGKSEFIDELCVRLNVRYGLKVAYFSPENMPLALHAVKIVEKLSGKRMQAEDDGYGFCIRPDEYALVKNYIKDNFFHIMPNNGYTIGNILGKAEYLIKEKGVRIIVIDPFNRVENEQTSSESETQYISRVLDSLTNFAQQHDVLVFLMAHPRKIDKRFNDGIPTLYDINGSANFFNKADYGIIVHRNREKKYTLVRIEKVKFRHLGQNGDALFKFNMVNGRYMPIPTPDSQPIYNNISFLDASGNPIRTDEKEEKKKSNDSQMVNQQAQMAMQSQQSYEHVITTVDELSRQQPIIYDTTQEADLTPIDDEDKIPF